METLYRIEELCTTGWEVVNEHLTRSEASERIQDLIREGLNPNYIRATRED